MDLKKLDKYKYPLLILIIGLALMLIPSRSSKASAPDENNISLCTALSSAEGVGNAVVLISENGVVVVCEGAEKASVRLDIIKAVGAYTGYGADKIVILKMVKN